MMGNLRKHGNESRRAAKESKPTMFLTPSGDFFSGELWVISVRFVFVGVCVHVCICVGRGPRGIWPVNLISEQTVGAAVSRDGPTIHTVYICLLNSPSHGNTEMHRSNNNSQKHVWTDIDQLLNKTQIIIKKYIWSNQQKHQRFAL